MVLNWKEIHLANEYIYDDRLAKHRERGWDFSHLDHIFKTLLFQMPNLANHDLYVYGSVESANDSTRPGSRVGDQIPFFVAISLPTGRVPTRTVGRINNHTSQMRVISFDDMSYDWAPATDPSYGGRLFYLVCNADYSAVPDDEYEARNHEFSPLFVVTPQDFATDDEGEYRVNFVSFSFLNQDGEVETTAWNRSEHPSLPDYLDQKVDECFELEDVEDVEEEEKVRVRERIEEAVQTEIRKIRAAQEERLNLFFGDLTWNQDSLGDLNMFKITPVNYSATIIPDLDRFFNDLVRQQVGSGERVVYSNHASVTGYELFRRLPPNNSLPGFNTELTPSSPAALFYSCLLVDFLHTTRYIDNLTGLSFDTPVIFDRILETFGIARVLQYFGQDTISGAYSFSRGRLTAFVRDVICANVEDSFRRVGRVSSTTSDFLRNFIVQRHSFFTETASPILGVERIRLGHSNDRRSSRNIIPGTISLEVTSTGSGRGRGFLPINMEQLLKLLKPEGVFDLVLTLLCNPEVEIPIPPGAHDQVQQEDEERDCLKGAILEAPDIMLSPPGKDRVARTFPSHEITIAHARSLLSSNVKTIRLKEIKTDVHTHAMTSNDVMVGVFQDGLQKHCVLIDGSNGAGCISDPAKGFGKRLVRSKRTLEKLRINTFRQLFVLKRVELSHKSRKGLEKRLGLPFLPYKDSVP